MIPPINEPPRPSATVAYHGIGSGPGSAQRARPPTTKPNRIRNRMKISKRLRVIRARNADGPRKAGRPTGAANRLREDRAAPVAEETPDDGDEDHGDDHADDELQQRAREDDPCNHERGDSDQDRDDPAHRIGARVEEPPQRTDEGANDDQPNPMHAFSFFRLSGEKRARSS